MLGVVAEDEGAVADWADADDAEVDGLEDGGCVPTSDGPGCADDCCCILFDLGPRSLTLGRAAFFVFSTLLACLLRLGNGSGAAAAVGAAAAAAAAGGGSSSGISDSASMRYPV